MPTRGADAETQFAPSGTETSASPTGFEADTQVAPAGQQPRYQVPTQAGNSYTRTASPSAPTYTQPLPTGSHSASVCDAAPAAPSYAAPTTGQGAPAVQYPSAPNSYPSAAPSATSPAAPQPSAAWLNASTGPQQPMNLNLGGAINWTDLAPTLVRSLLAIMAALTALGNLWVIDTDGATMTHSAVLPLIGCVGVTLASLAHIALHPQFLGKSLPALARVAVPAALTLPALIAVVLTLATSLSSFSDALSTSAFGNVSGSGDRSIPGFALLLLAFAVGLTLSGLSTSRDLVPARTLDLVVVGVAALGIVLSLVAIAQMLGADGVTGKVKWLGILTSYLFIIALGALIIWVKLTNRAFAHGFVWALGAAVAVSLLLRGWFAADGPLAAMMVLRNGHGAALIALALGLAMTSADPIDRSDLSARATRASNWVIPALGVSAAASLVTALLFIGARDDINTGGQTWFLVLMLISAASYAGCAWLLRHHAAGRLITICVIATLTLTIAITTIAAKTAGVALEPFTEGSYLWLPVLIAGALTIPPSVRAVSGSLLPRTATTSQPIVPAQNQ